MLNGRIIHTDLPTKSVGQSLNNNLIGILLLVPLTLSALSYVRPTAFFRGIVCCYELLFILIYLFGFKPDLHFPSFKNSSTFRLYLAWAVWAFLAVAVAGHPVPALVRQSEWICHSLFAFMLWNFFRDNPEKLSWVFVLLPAGFILPGISIILQWHVMRNPFNHDWVSCVPFFSNIRHLGYHAVGALIYSAYPLLSLKFSPKRIIIVFFSLSFCWAFLFWSGGRGALLAAICGFAAIIYLMDKQHRSKLLGVVFITALVGLWASSYYDVSTRSLGFFNAFERSISRTSINGFTSGRIHIWLTTLSALKDKIWFGLGPEGFLYYFAPNWNIAHPHNVFVQILAEWGIVGTIVFIILLFKLFCEALKNIKRENNKERKPARLAAMGVISAYTIGGLVDGTYYFALPLMILSVSFSIVLPPYNKSILNIDESACPENHSLWSLKVISIVIAAIFVFHISSFSAAIF